MSNLIPPHGGKGLTVCLLEGAEKEAELKKAAGLKQVEISPRVKGDLIMIGIGPQMAPFGRCRYAWT